MRAAGRPLPCLLVLGLLAPACAVVEGPRDERLRSDVRWLADEERDGRRSGTAGEREVAEWIAARLSRLGLDPAGEEGYFQRFPVPLTVRDGGGSYLVAKWTAEQEGEVARRIERGQPFSFSAGGRADGPLVFGGYGAPEGTFLPAGAVLLLVAPRAPDPAGEPLESPAPGALARIFRRTVWAGRRGAAGVLFAPHPDDPAGVPQPFDPAWTAVAPIPALAIDAETAESLLPGYAERVRALDRTGRAGDAVQAERFAVEVYADVHRDEGSAVNVLASLPGGAGAAVVLCARLDHLGRGGLGSLAPEATAEVHSGAEAASGAAVLLEVARALTRRDEAPLGDVLFAFFSGSEQGRQGSELWCTRPSVPLERVAAGIVVDPVGRAGDGDLFVLGVGTAAPFTGWMEFAGRRAALDLDASRSTKGLGGGPAQSLVDRGIPVLCLFSGLHSDSRTPADRSEAFEAEGAAKVATLALDLLDRLQLEQGLRFATPPPPPVIGERGFPVRFGAVRDLEYEGEGLRLADVTPGSPAERAGLLPGDVLRQIGGLEILTMADFVAFLQMHRPGDVVAVRFERDGVEHGVLASLARRELAAPSEAAPATDGTTDGTTNGAAEEASDVEPAQSPR